jgi:hypothetical protein
MHENILSKYKRVYSRHPSQLNLVHIWYHKDVETVRDLEQAQKKVNDILRHMKSLGIEVPPPSRPKPKKSHSVKKKSSINTLTSI